MNAIVKKVTSVLDGVEVTEHKICSGAGIGEYVFVNAQVIISIEMNGKTENIVFQNGHSYKGGNYDCPSNTFQVYQPDWLRKIDDICDVENEDEDDLKSIIEQSEGLLQSVEDIKAVALFVSENTPTIQDIGESSDVDDYDTIVDEFGYKFIA